MLCWYLVLSDTRSDSFSSSGKCSLTLSVYAFPCGALCLCFATLECFLSTVYWDWKCYPYCFVYWNITPYSLSVLFLTFSPPNGCESYQFVYTHSLLRFPYFLFIYFKKVCAESAWQVTRATTWSDISWVCTSLLAGPWQVRLKNNLNLEPARWSLGSLHCHQIAPEEIKPQVRPCPPCCVLEDTLSTNKNAERKSVRGARTEDFAAGGTQRHSGKFGCSFCSRELSGGASWNGNRLVAWELSLAHLSVNYTQAFRCRWEETGDGSVLSVAGSSWEAGREEAAWGWCLLAAGAVCAGAGGAAWAALLASCKNNQPAHRGCCYWRGWENGMHPLRHLKASAISIIHLTVLAGMNNFQRFGHDCVRFCKYQKSFPRLFFQGPFYPPRWRKLHFYCFNKQAINRHCDRRATLYTDVQFMSMPYCFIMTWNSILEKNTHCFNYLDDTTAL